MKKKQQQRNATGTQYTQNSLAYKHHYKHSVIAANIYNFLFHRRSNGNQEKQHKSQNHNKFNIW